jgi:hypothetical protein
MDSELGDLGYRLGTTLGEESEERERDPRRDHHSGTCRLVSADFETAGTIRYAEE